ncbi:centrosome-associated protein 350-like isoform X2 [Acanthaster planci]|uniref:Centrosome-associated protein 350-like isoform X2 n=1 Tax=Acanthaster planci TaxID=133434 RepID=A0A8B7XVP9_ACAPL|nr:centrosome-associated protein 350-like isoform X2 [Acanthaster planci]
MSGSIRVRRVADPTPVQRGPAPFPKYDDLTTAWNNHAEAKSVLRRTEARLEEAEFYSNAAHSPGSQDPRGKLSPSYRHYLTGMENLARVQVPVERVPSVEIGSHKHQASNRYSHLNYGRDKVRKRVTIVDNLEGDQGSSHHLSPPRSKRDRLAEARNLDSLSPTRSVDSAQVQRLEHQLKSLSRTLKSSTLDRTHPTQASYDHHLMDKDWEGVPPRAESYDHRTSPKSNALSPSSQEILSRGSTNMSVDNSTAIRVLNDLLPRQQLEQGRNQKLRYQENYVPAYERLFGTLLGERSSERQETFTKEEESDALQRDATRLRAHESRKLALGGSASDHMERLREKVEQQKAAVANCKQMTGERTRHRDGDPVILQDPDTEGDSHLAGYPLPAGKSTVRKVATAPAAPAYKGFSEVETRFQMPDGKVVTEDQLTRKTSRKTSDKSTNRTTGKVASLEDRALKPSMALQQQNKPGQSSKSSRTVRKVHKGPPKILDKRPKRPDRNKDIISAAAWREGQKTVLKILGPPPEKPKMAAKQPAPHSPPTHDTEDPPSSKHQDLPLSVEDRTKDDFSDAELSEHPLERKEVGDNDRVPSPTPDLEKLPSEAKNVLEDLHLDPSTSEDEKPVSRDQKDGQKAPKIPKKKSARPPRPNPDPVFPAERVRHYDTDKVRRYMAKQKAERRRRLQEEKAARNLAQERKQEQLRELSKKQKDSVRLSQKNRSVANGQLGETFSKDPTEEVIGSQLNGLDQLPRHIPFRQDGKKIDVTSSDKENKNIWSTSSSDSSTQSSLPSDPPHSPLDQAPPTHSDPLGGIADSNGRTEVQPPPRPGSPIGVVVTQITGGVPDGGQRSAVPVDPGQRAEVMQPSIIGQAPPSTGISRAARSKADRIQALKATAAALQGKIDSEVKKLTGDFQPQAVTSPVDVNDRWAYPSGSRMATPIRSVHFGGSAVALPVGEADSPEAPTRYQRMVGSDRDHKVFTGSLPGTGILSAQARLAQDASNQEHAATRIQAAYRGHSVRQKLDWSRPSLGNAVQRQSPNTVPEVHVSRADQSSPLNNRGVYVSASLSEGSLSEGSLTDTAAEDKDYMPIFKSLPTTHGHQPPPGTSSDSPLTAVGLPTSPASRPISLPVQGADRWKESLADGLSVINIYTRKYQNANRVVLYGQLPTDSAKPKDSIIGYSCNDDFTGSPTTSSKSSRSKPEDDDPYSADFTADSSSKTKSKSKSKSTTSCSKSSYGTASNRKRSSRSGVTEQTPSRKADDNTLDLSPVESFGSSGDDVALHKGIPRTPSPKVLLSTHRPSTDRRTSPSHLTPNASLGSKSPSSPDSTLSSGSLPRSPATMEHQPGQRRSPLSGSKSPSGSGQSKPSLSSYSTDTRTRSSISTASSSAKGTENLFKPVNCVPSMEPGSDKGSERLLPQSARLHPSAAGRPPQPAQYSPAALSLKLASELNLLESLEESVRQLSDLERTRHISLAQQESVSLARVLQARQRDHEREIQLLSLKARQEVEEANKQLEVVRQRAVETASDAERVLAQARREAADAVSENARRLMETQAEAARVTAEAAKQMAEAQRMPAQPPPPSYDPGKLASDTATAATTAAVTAALEQQRLQQIEFLKEMKGPLAPPTPAVHTRSLGVVDRTALSGGQPSQASYSGTQASYTSHSNSSASGRSDSPHSPKQDYTDDFTDSAKSRRSPTNSVSTGTIPKASSLSPVSDHTRPRWPKSPNGSDSIRTASDVPSTQDGSSPSIPTESGFSPAKVDFSLSRRSNSSIKTASDVDAVSTVRSPSIAEDIPDKQHSSYYSSSGESRTKTSPSLTPSSTSTPIRAKDEVRRPPHMVSDLTLDLDDSFTLSAEMLRQQLRDEEVRARQQAALFKLREKTLMEKAKVELEWLEHEKKRYKESGDTEKLQAARKRQQVLVTRVQQEQAEIRRLRAAQKAASHERQLLLYQQQEIARMRKATEAVRVQMRDLSNVSISSSLGGALSGSDQASVAASPSPTSPDLPEVLSDSSPDSPSVPNAVEEGEEKKLQPGVGPAYDKEGSVKGELTPAEKQAQVMLKLKKMQQPLSMKYLTKREQQLTKRRRNAEELLAWQRRLDEEEKQVVSMEREAMRRLDSSGGTAKSRPPMKALPPSHQALRDDSARDSDSASRITSEAVMDADSTRPHAREEGRREEDGRQASSGSVPEDISHDSSVPEEVISDSSPKISTTRTASVPSNDDTLKHSDSILEEYTSESFESADRTLTPARSSPAPPPPAAAATIPLRSSQHSTPPSSLDSFRAPLSPHRRILESESGSESEKSFSQTVSEIASDQSDIEGRVKALESELRKRKMEADKLRRQQKRMQREKLKAQEASLKKQLEAYDKLIEKTKAELKNESEAAGAKSASSMAVKPQIKQLRLTEAQRLKDRSHTRSLRQRTASESSSGRDGRAELGGAMHKQRSVSEGSMSSRSSLDEEAGLGRDHSYSSVGSVFTPPTTPRLAEDTTPPPPKSLSPSPSTKRDKSSISASISEEVFERTSSSTSDEDSQRVVTASRKSQSPDELSHRRGGPQHLEECEEQRDSSALSEVSEDVPSAYSSVSATPEISLKESPRSDVETDVQKASLSVKAREEYQEVKDQRSEQSEASTVPEEVFSAGSSLSQDSIRSISKKIVLDERKYSPKTEPAENVETLEKKSPALVAGRSADDLSQKSEKSYSLSSSVRSSHRSRTQSEQSGASYSEDFVESSISIGVKNKESYLEDTDDDISEQLSIASEPSEPSFASSGKPSFILSPGKLSLEAAKNDLEVAPEVTVSERGSSEEQEKLEAVSEDDERTPVPSPQEEQLETSQDFTGYQIGDRVMVGSKEQGTLLFKGMTHFAPGWWGGVELDDQKGTNDGSLDGHVYFQCKPSHGMFVPADRLEHLAPEPEREETEPEEDSPVEEDLPSVASEGSNISQRKILQGLKDKENDKPEYSLLSSLSSKTPSEPIKPLAQVLKSEATDDDSVVEDLSEPMTDDAALAALISSAAAAVESFHEDDINHIFPQSADAQTPRGAPEQEASPSRSKEQLVDSITDHLTAIVMKDSVKAIAEVAERHTLQDDGRKEISEAKGSLRSTSTEKPSGSLLGMLVQDDAIKSTRDVMQDKGERQDKVDEKANQKVAIKRKIDSTTQTLLTEAITEIMTLRNKRAKQKESEGNLRTTSLPESPKSPSPETPCPSPFVRVATPYTPDSESPIPQEDATLDDDIFINRVKVETNNLDLKDQDQFPVARPGSPVFGESSGFNPEALSEKLEQMQQLNADIFEGDLFGEQEWFDDDFGSMPKSKSIIQVPVRSQEVSVRSLPPSPSTPEPSRLDLTRIAQEPFYAIPHNRRDVKSLVGRSVQVVHEKAVLGERTASLFPPAEIMGEDIQGSDIESTSQRSYKRLIFDLVGEAYQDITSEQEQGEQLPWTKTKRRPRKYFFDRPPRELPDLAQVVEDRALFVTGLAGRPKPDPALARFGGKKKKDHVDEILTLELREEEQEWVNYDDDELAVKMQLTEAIFDSLLTDTAMALNRIQDRRRARMTPQEPEIEF